MYKLQFTKEKFQNNIREIWGRAQGHRLRKNSYYFFY